jgi:hypothetical protein
MPCKKPSPLAILLINTLIVGIVFMVIDFLWYGLISPGPDPYMMDIGNKILFTVILSIGFAHMYNKVSRMWRPGSDESFVYKQYAAANACAANWPKIANGLYFAFLTSIVMIMVVALSSFFMVTIYLFIFHGVRGDLELSGQDAAVTTGKFLIAAAGLELSGKTESDPDR